MAAGDGLVTMKPTSITHSGTSATINADGGVDFTAVTSLSLNGVFTSDYDNYVIVISGSGDGSASSVRLRSSGTDATGSNYDRQYLYADSTTVAAQRATFATSSNFFVFEDNNPGWNGHLYGPALAQPTAARSFGIGAGGSGLPYIIDYAWTHSLSTSYDGITIFPGTGSITGNVHVFGYEE